MNFCLIVFLIFSVGCIKQTNSNQQPTTDYSAEDLWYNLPASSENPVDVFYILPTCIWDWQDSNGNIYHYADINNSEQREAMQSSFELAKTIFADSTCNFFAPYYRQISLNSWIDGDSVVSARFPLAMQDIQTAFDYFIVHKNNNRPFIIAGYSQGAKGVVELLKTMPENVYSRMIAAYVIGYRITSNELNSYSKIKPAQDSIAIGVTICYNSVEKIESICPVLSPTDVCINPINWRIDQTSALLNDSITVKIDISNKVLLVEGFNSKDYFYPILADLFVEGNYHLQELNFYKIHLNTNVKQRIRNYHKQSIQ